jgi:hypothetical protein
MTLIATLGHWQAGSVTVAMVGRRHLFFATVILESELSRVIFLKLFTSAEN